MKIVLVTQNAPLYLPSFLQRFLAQKKHDVVGVLFTSTHSGSLLQEVCNRIAYYGLLAFIQTSIRIAWAIMKGSTPKSVLRKHTIPILPFTNVNDPAFHEYIMQNDVSVVLSLAAMQIFKKPVLTLPNVRVLNYHTALLPRHRGRQPLFWTLITGDTEGGVTMHEVDEHIDTGPIVGQRSFPVDATDTLHSLYGKSMEAGLALMNDVLDACAQNSITATPQNSDEGNYNGFPQAADRKKFFAAGKKFY